MGILSIFKAKKECTEPESDRTKHTLPLNMAYHKQNLVTVLMLKNYGNASPILPLKKYPQYFSSEDYDVGNPRQLHESLVQKGFLIPSTPEEILSSLTVAELKSILSAHSLPGTGRKADLIQYIINSINIDELDISGKETCYSLSDTGQKFLDDNYDYVLFHKHRVWQLPFEEYCSFRNKIGGNKFYEIAEKLLTEEIKQSPREAHVRYSYCTLSEVYRKLEVPEKSLLCLLYAQYIDLNGNYNHPSHKLFLQGIITKKEFLQSLKNDKFFIEAVVSGISGLQECFSEAMVKEVYSNKPVETQYCNEMEFRNVIHDIFSKKDFPKKKWTSYFMKNFLEYHQI